MKHRHFGTEQAYQSVLEEGKEETEGLLYESASSATQLRLAQVSIIMNYDD